MLDYDRDSPLAEAPRFSDASRQTQFPDQTASAFNSANEGNSSSSENMAGKSWDALASSTSVSEYEEDGPLSPMGM